MTRRRRDTARAALEGLSVGDGFGDRFMFPREPNVLPAPPWYWSDDTEMTLSVYEAAVGGGRSGRSGPARLRSPPAMTLRAATGPA